MRLISRNPSRRTLASVFPTFLLAAAFLLASTFTAPTAFSQARPIPKRGALPDPPPPPPDIFLVELRRRARGSDDQLAESIRDALRLKLDSDASSFLESIAQRQWDDAARRRAAQVISGADLLRATLDDSISAAAKAQAVELLAAQKRIDQAPERLAAAIAAVGSGDTERELPAMRTLLSGGIASIGPLALAAAEQTDPQRRDALLRVLARLGPDSVFAIESLAIYAPPAIRGGAVVALNRLKRDAALVHLCVAAHAADATAEERLFASEQLIAQFGKVPSLAETETLLVQQIDSLRIAAGRLARSSADGFVWSPDPQSNQPVPTPTTEALAVQRRVVDHTRLLYRLGNLSPVASMAAVTADLAYRFQVDPLALPDQMEELRQLWGDEMFSARSLSAIIGHTIEDDDLAAAVAAMSLVGPSITGDRYDLLATGSAALAPLVAAAQHWVPQVRFEATTAILRLEPQSAFPGASIVVDRLNEMVALTRDPIALIVDTRVERESQIERLIASLGYRVEVANSVSGAIRQVALGGDLRLVISTSTLPDRSVLELVDGIRRHPFGRQAAIFIHGPHDSSIQVAVDEKRWDRPVFHIELPNSAAGWGVHLAPVVDQPIGRLQGFDPLSAAQRFEFRRQAVVAIGKLTSQPDLFGFFDIQRLVGGSLAEASPSDPEVAKVAFGDPRLALLSASANGQSQAALVEMMLRQSANQTEIGAAAKALRVSIQRHGVLMNSTVISRLGVAASSMDAGPQQQAVAEIVELIANRFGFIVVGAGD